MVVILNPETRINVETLRTMLEEENLDTRIEVQSERRDESRPEKVVDYSWRERALKLGMEVS